MNTLHFKYAVEIEKTRSITQAAENLYMAQPNLSKAIKELENTLGITIFRRTPKGVVPTEQGVRFLEYAKQILVQIDNMQAIRSPDMSGASRLRISVPRTAYIAKAFTDFICGESVSGDMQISCFETSAVRTIEAVRDNSCDIGIIRFNTAFGKYYSDCLDEKKLVSQTLWDFAMTAVMPEAHPAAMQDGELTYSALSEKYTELLNSDGGVPYLSPDSMKLPNELAGIPESGKKICVCDRGSIMDMLCSLPDAFTLDAPVPDEVCRRYRLVCRKCSFSGNSFRDAVIFRSDKAVPDTALRFVNKLCEIRNTAVFGSSSAL